MGIRGFFQKYKVEIWRYSIFNSRAATAHLNQMAERGLHFITLFTGVFPVAVYLKKQEKGGVRYAVDVFQENKEELERSYEKLYQDAGWEPMETECDNGVRFYRSTKEGIQLPYNDEETEILHLAEHGVNNALIGKRMASGAAFLLCGYILGIWVDIEPAGFADIIHMVGILSLIYGGLCVFSCIFNSAYVTSQEKRMQRGRE